MPEFRCRAVGLQLVKLLARDLPADGYRAITRIRGSMAGLALAPLSLAAASGAEAPWVGVGLVLGHVRVPGVADADQPTREAVGKNSDHFFKETTKTFLESQSMALVEKDEMDCVKIPRISVSTPTGNFKCKLSSRTFWDGPSPKGRGPRSITRQVRAA